MPETVHRDVWLQMRRIWCMNQVYGSRNLSLDDSVLGTWSIEFLFFLVYLKKRQEKPFVTYLTDYRMDHCGRTDSRIRMRKVITIAERVGYLDANYFSYVFKKRFGVSPSKYRTEHLKK